MKYLFINSLAGCGSTGRIVEKIARELSLSGHECAIAYGRELVGCEGIITYKIGSKLDVMLHGVKGRLFDGSGFGSKRVTEKLLNWIDEYKPDVIWLHNIHGYYLNVEMLFDYLKAHPEIEVKWTLHDCWTFTGHCAWFSYVKCNKWKTKCENCPQTRTMYPVCIGIPNTIKNYERKKAAFTGVKNLSIIVPSKWLANLVKESFLADYPVEVIYNTIDTELFKPTEGDFRKNNGLENKKIILGVANVWEERKGLTDFIKLAEMLDEIEKDLYKVVLVGLTKEQVESLPKNILGITRTSSAKELAEIYTAADVFLNLTYEDNYPTTNLEAQACGTPCITYRTGGSPESVPEENVIEVGNLDLVKEKILSLI